ncbi:serine/threonine-protein phosphatase 6 regulatory ankyrin repeat subunit C-like [Saccostrea echinata]|uniref:serine/threonine-protein phosphatase 6 regulatory ankyrin repeat subunit C-like n=1 Tax=Saccostrea echinata TaxID=191078 RepID=UPI002A8113E1|nr:serine/threonine-protein phosphatase 6 regulatory ankyrin repeat subunit C-like [Saccostrea echinata]
MFPVHTAMTTCTTQFFDALTNKDHDKILELTSNGLLKMKKKFNYRKKNGPHEADEMSALLLTIKYCYRKDIIEKMIASGANVNATGYEYLYRNLSRKRLVTPLYLAVNRSCNKELLKCLISAGADLNKFSGQITENEEEGGSMVMDSQSASLNFALHSQYYDAEVIDILLENGADLNIKNDSSLLPLQIATLYNYSDAVLSLVRYGASTSPSSYSEYSPLALLLDSAELLSPDDELSSEGRAEKRFNLLRCVQILLNGGYDVLCDTEMQDLCQKSKCGEEMDDILLEVAKIITAWVYQPKDLKVLCRLKIRHNLQVVQTACNPKILNKLPLPKALINYLNLSDFD